MSTLDELIVKVSRALRDEGNDTFTTALVTDLINDAIVEVGRFAPRQFQEDIEATGAQSYNLLEGEAPRARLHRVEIWQASPSMPLRIVPSMSGSLSNSSQAGWDVRNGVLTLPYPESVYAADDTKVIRVWGYVPWLQLAAGSDESDMDADAEEAARFLATAMGYDRLASERALFAQYQKQSNNTDLSFNMLLSSVSFWRNEANRRRKQLVQLRELPD